MFFLTRLACDATSTVSATSAVPSVLVVAVLLLAMRAEERVVRVEATLASDAPSSARLR
ncbi:hypothetical protein DAEQUDRAFT_725841 [Daedalea quercina L-15889]|uniref:Uncharacterized protein n=1 Tax=Daedalea quercina L-15889 TaxID=1314783 RepID=A0A165R2C7_9APHY|nr:hypothetical protein DAEQUDRAFT_725841 [Daedalea quercina L-15889]